MSACGIHESGAIELFFYDELEPGERARVHVHLRGCRECASALAELQVIRDALAARRAVDAPPAGWSAFMERLDASVAERPQAVVIPFSPPASRVRAPYTWLTAAALIALVSIGVFMASRAGHSALGVEPPLDPARLVAHEGAAAEALPVAAGLTSVGLRHLERSKLVVLGLATKEAAEAPASDWAYERELASALLADTRLYRMAAEERGLTSLAGVMKDLELVLLQASMAQETDNTALPQIQRLIRKRGLVEKMDVVGTTGLMP